MTPEERHKVLAWFANNSGGYPELSGWAADTLFYLPPTSDSEGIPLVSGETTVIYGDTLLNVHIDNNLSVKYVCDIGYQDGNNLVINTTEVGLHLLTIHIYDGRQFVETKITYLNVLLKATAEKSILMVGDSLMYLGVDHELSELESILSGLTLTTIGTQTLN